MNRLVLIGNGYDIAAGLPTSYEDFLVDLFITSINKVAERVILVGNPVGIEETFFTTTYNRAFINKSIFEGKLKGIKTLKDLFSHHMIKFVYPQVDGTLAEQTIVNSSDGFEIHLTSQFLVSILGDNNWKDIENYYFNRLLKIFEGPDSVSFKKQTAKGTVHYAKKKEELIIELNRDFNELKNKLAEYISKISESINNNTIGKPLSCFTRIVEPLEDGNFERFFNNDKTSKTNKELKNVFVVNFNYTPNFSTHFFKELFDEENISVANIHGYFEKPEEIIFGYGDDSHPLYAQLEASGNDEYLKFIKSFHYPHSKSYIELMNFIESDQFEVQVIGHSLGLSDRVLLKSIFENENCKMIKLYHRGNKKDMIHKYMALSRHCSDKAAMRRKILEYDERDVVNDIAKS